MKVLVVGILMFLVVAGGSKGESAPISDDTQSCLECHEDLNPGIVSEWKKSRHAQITPAEAIKVGGLARKVSSKSVPESLKDKVLGCAECHTLRSGEHRDTFDHNGYPVHVVVSPRDCATCHTDEARQFEENLMSHAYGNLVDNPVFQLLMAAINGTAVFQEGKILLEDPGKAVKAESCLYCHGTKLEVKGFVRRETMLGEMEFPVIEGWPNQGTGRINLDGSRGTCTACHTRHQFSIEMARKPYTCKECHVGPDVPAFKVYEASKHGTLFSTHNRQWNFNAVPWTIGKDFTAPTCAVCHMSLVVDSNGEIVAERSHEVKNRLPYRIFGLIYAHPHPRSANTTIIRNKAGLPLPTDFDGGFATGFLLNDSERNKARETMQAPCLSCHAKSWVANHWDRFENTIRETNGATLTATGILGEIWKRGDASGLAKGSSPFDEYIERKWADGWLFYANSVRFASAMAGGGDYGVFADGRYALSKNLQELLDWLHVRMKIKE